MISYIEGKILKINTDSIIVLTAAGIGFTVYVPRSVFKEVSSIGHEIYLYTYFQVKEDGMALFGFLDETELDIFNMLVTVSGVGPKLAISVLSTLSGTDLCFAIASGDVKTISTAPGVGKKMAEKIIVELKDKVEKRQDDDFCISKEALTTSNGKTDEIRKEAVDGLAALGFSMTEGMKAVREIPITDDTTSESLLKNALTILYKGL